MSVQSATASVLDLDTFFSQYDEKNQFVISTLKKYTAQIFDPSLVNQTQVESQQKKYTPVQNNEIVQRLFAQVHAQALELNAEGKLYTEEQCEKISLIFKKNAEMVESYFVNMKKRNFKNNITFESRLRQISNKVPVALECSSIFVSVINNSPFNYRIFLSDQTPVDCHLFSPALKNEAALAALSGENKKIDSKVVDYNQFMDDTIYVMHQIISKATVAKRPLTEEEKTTIHKMFEDLKENAEQRVGIVNLQSILAAKNAEIVSLKAKIQSQTQQLENDNKTLEAAKAGVADETVKTALYNTISELYTNFNEIKAVTESAIATLESEVEEVNSRLVGLKESVGEEAKEISEEVLKGVTTLAKNVPTLIRAACGFHAYLNSSVSYEKSKPKTSSGLLGLGFLGL